MKERIVPILPALAALLALSVGLSTAQGPGSTLPTGPQSGGEPQAAVGSAFTYQGELKKDNSPVNDACTMAFSLYDDDNAGNCVGGPITTTVNVAEGLFTVALDFGSGPFTGEARWLEIAVRCTPDPGFNTLTPRQALTAVPYALSLQPGATVIGAVSDGAALSAYNIDTAAGLYAYGLLGRVSSTKGTAVFGHANAFSGETYGVYGRADSPTGTGVAGHATATSGTTYGVYGRADSSAGYGVYGYNASGVAVYGVGQNAVLGESSTPDYGAVVGRNTATTGTGMGVYGSSASPAGAGVYGRASADSGYTNGVFGISNSPHGNGVFGRATSTSGPAWGVGGQSDSTEGRGVVGLAEANTGTTCGVYGQAASSAGYGVYGYNASTSSGVAIYGQGPNAVLGDSSTPNYGAVVGRNFATTGTGMGVYGSSAATGGRGVYGYASAASGVAVGVVGETESPDGFGVYSWGNFAATGTKSAVVQTQDHGWRSLYAMESPEVLFEDVGTAQLTDGQAVVPIDPIFAQTVNLEQPYQVFLTPQGGYCALYVAEKTTASFTVRAQEGSSCQIAFDYRIIAKRLGYEDVRLEPAQPPARAQNEPGALDPTGTDSSVAVPAHEGNAQMRPAPVAVP